MVFGTVPLSFFQLHVTKHHPAPGMELETNSTFFLEHLKRYSRF
jgi:hypothetical protein